MPWKSATKVELSGKQGQILKEYAAGTHTPLHFKTRAKIVLKASEGCTNNSIERDMGLDANVVKRWRDRYSSRHEELKKVEAETPRKLRSTIENILSDEQRPGSPAKFTDEQVAVIIAMACEDPAQQGLPFSHWTPGLLQIEVIKRGIADSISVRQIGRFLKRKGVTAAQEPMLVKPEHKRYRAISKKGIAAMRSLYFCSGAVGKRSAGILNR